MLNTEGQWHLVWSDEFNGEAGFHHRIARNGLLIYDKARSLTDGQQRTSALYGFN